jgi:mannose/fructose/N-acetylgalactosamine-specific phosphotransferase system component IIC
MILLLFFLIGFTLAFFLAPDWPLVATLGVPLAVVLAGRLALFWWYGKRK